MNYKQISKITMYSIIMGIFAIIGIITFSVDFPNWAKYGSNFLVDPINPTNPIDLLPISVQVSRAWSAISLIISALLIGLISWEIKKMEKTNYKKIFVCSLGIFTWLIIPYAFYIGIKNKLYSEFFNYISQNRVGNLQLSFASFKKGFTKNGNRDKLFWNTTFGYFLFLITLVGFIFCFLISANLFGIKAIHPITDSQLKPGFTVEDYYSQFQVSLVFETFSFFTQLSNIACFIFMLSFVLFSKKIPFRNNTIMIAVSSYIFVVSVIFWVYLFPQSIANNKYIENYQWVKTTWLHAVTPILFISFFVTSVLMNKSNPTKLIRLMSVSVIYPLFYGLYIYSLPFYTRFSVYGSLTNLNPNMDTSIGIKDVSHTGSWWMIFGLLGLGCVFMFVFLGFWSIPFLINRKENKKMKLA